jgi:hypothetical protein
MRIDPDTPLTYTLPAGIWQLLRVGLDYVPAARVLTDQAISAVEAEHVKAVAALSAPAEPPPPGRAGE